MTDWPLTTNFRASEFRCQHCGAAGIQLALVEALQELRDYLGRQMIITSGYRCAKHPIEAAKGKPGVHTQGIAADIRVDGIRPAQVYQIVLDHFPKFTGLGVAPAQGFNHLDIRKLPTAKAGSRVVWAYDRTGKDVRWNGRIESLPK